MSSILGHGLFLNKVYIDMTIPGVQNPHWEPWASANFCWTACNLVLVDPIPSTVVMAVPCIPHNGARQAFTELWCIFSFSMWEIITVQAPHPPSPHPNLVPYNPRSFLRNCKRVWLGSGFSTWTFCPENKSKHIHYTGIGSCFCLYLLFFEVDIWVLFFYQNKLISQF